MKKRLILSSMLIVAAVVAQAQNASGNANAIPIGGTNSTGYGFKALSGNTGAGNTGVGYNTLIQTTSGTYNTGHGYRSLLNNKTGDFNTGVGANVLATNATGQLNTAIGYQADVNATNLSNATAIGANAVVTANNAIQLGDGNVTDIYAGTGSMATIYTGGLRVSGGTPAAGKVLTSDALGNATWQAASASGAWSLLGNAGTTSSNFLGTTDGAPVHFRTNNTPSGEINTNNVFLGYQAGQSVTTGATLAGFGPYALSNNSSGICNSAAGGLALYQNTSGYYNNATGYAALRDNNTGAFNTADGAAALVYSTGDNNTGIGCGAMGNITSGYGNTALGSQANSSNTSQNNSMALGYGAIVNANDKTRIGNANMTVTECQAGIYTVSDGRFKNKISESDVKGLEFIKLLRPVEYNFDTKSFTEFLTKNMPDSTRKKYLSQDFSASSAMRHTGFIAQEVEKAAKDVKFEFSGVHTPVNANDNYSIAYDQLVVPLVKAVQEMDKQNSELKAMINDMQKQISDLTNANAKTGAATGINQINPGVAGFTMEQNEPNPFSTETVIRYNMPESVNNAYVAVYDLSGKQIASLPLAQKGSASVTITSEKLAAGMYIYSVVADNKVIDTKRMIVTAK